jgi:hypothetical protein
MTKFLLLADFAWGARKSIGRFIFTESFVLFNNTSKLEIKYENLLFLKIKYIKLLYTPLYPCFKHQLIRSHTIIPTAGSQQYVLKPAIYLLKGEYIHN